MWTQREFFNTYCDRFTADVAETLCMQDNGALVIAINVDAEGPQDAPRVLTCTLDEAIEANNFTCFVEVEYGDDESYPFIVDRALGELWREVTHEMYAQSKGR